MWKFPPAPSQGLHVMKWRMMQLFAPQSSIIRCSLTCKLWLEHKPAMVEVVYDLLQLFLWLLMYTKHWNMRIMCRTRVSERYLCGRACPWVLYRSRQKRPCIFGKPNIRRLILFSRKSLCSPCVFGRTNFSSCTVLFSGHQHMVEWHEDPLDAKKA